MKIVDHKGNELRAVLLQVLTSDDDGSPITLRARYDDGEKIDLTVPESQRKFHIVYAPANATLGNTSWNEIVNEVEALRSMSVQREYERKAMNEEAASIKREVDAITAEIEKKTEALREMQRERDPERVNALIRSAVSNATRTHEAELKIERAKSARLESEVNELRASKKKLKEANERLKDGRK